MPVPKKTLSGTVERIVFTNEENGYTIARFKADRRYDVMTIVGPLAGVKPGARLKVEGVWKVHPKYGDQFEIHNYREEMPATVEGIRKYLGSGLIKGIGPVTARRIAEHFGTYTLEVIETDIGRLNEVSGVGPKRVKVIANAWEEQKQVKEIMLFLQTHDVSTQLAVKIYKTYGDASIATVQNEPYRLARDIYGIGFLTADRIACNLGVAHDSPQRVAAGIEYTLNQLADEGHVYAPRETLLARAAKILEVKDDLVAAQLPGLAAEERVVLDRVAEDEVIYLTPFYRAEVGVTKRLQTLLAGSGSKLPEFQAVDWEQALAYLGQKSGLTLAGRQVQAVQTALTSKVSILTGGPGTGKTSTVRGLLALLRAKRKRVLLAAPTGRAAKRLSETTGHEAKTIHRLLEVDPGAGFRFKRNQNNPLEADMVIIDEVSMIDLVLMNALLRAVDPASHLLLVGDADQLPSVGAGNVLRDLIASERVPVVRLDVVFRQAADSTIITNAHRINRGEFPRFPQDRRDFFFFGKEDPTECAELLVDIVARRIPAKFGHDPLSQIQVLSPMTRGQTGTRALNEVLQARLNPPHPARPEYKSGGRLFRQGDRVIQLRNNYDKDVYNGDLGLIQRIDLEEGEVVVDIDKRPVRYELSDLDELALAYALTIHKSQGSEYPVVVIPLLTQHYLMLQRNLLYTGVTRAREMVVLVGTRKAMAMAVRNAKIGRRWSGLAWRLQN
ncbi:MAG: ATP-dependent RecD-like DNA helicase [Anaerolineae bacterium]